MNRKGASVPIELIILVGGVSEYGLGGKMENKACYERGTK